MISNRLPADVLSASLYQLLPYCFAAMKSPIRAASSCRTSCQTINISELGQIGDHSDATCDASNRDVYEYVEVKEHRMLLSQRSEIPQFLAIFRSSSAIHIVEATRKIIIQSLSERLTVLKSICPRGLWTAAICIIIALPTPRRTQWLEKGPTEKIDFVEERALKAWNH